MPTLARSSLPMLKPKESPTPPSQWIRRWSHLVAGGGPVLDVASGSGRHLRWFADSGHPVTGIDRDPRALEAAALAGSAVACDLESEAWPLSGRTFAGVVVTNYLWRPLFQDLIRSLAPGGVLMVETFADGQALFGRPRRAEFLLRRGELLRLCEGLQVVAFEDGVEACPSACPSISPDEPGRDVHGADHAFRCVQRIVAIKVRGDSIPIDHKAVLPELRETSSPR